LKMDFLDGKLDVNESFSSKITTKIIAKSGLKPLIKLSQLKVKLSGEAELDSSIYKGIVDEVSDKFGRDLQLSVETDKLELNKEILTFEEVDVKEI
ncbi:hypothetical protein, partial [Acetobacterium wieringae]